jgi:hypothetical protein
VADRADLAKSCAVLRPPPALGKRAAIGLLRGYVAVPLPLEGAHSTLHGVVFAILCPGQRCTAHSVSRTRVNALLRCAAASGPRLIRTLLNAACAAVRSVSV